jgi:hypothetical protein
MSLNATSLVGAVSAGQTQITLTSGTGVAVGKIIRIDGEKVEILSIANSPTLLVRRGVSGTAAIAHDPLAQAVIGDAADFPPTIFPLDPKQRSYGQDGAIAVEDSQDTLNKATAGAYTLADPTHAQNFITKVITSRTAAAHVITGVNIWDGTAGVNTTLTFAAVAGASVTLQAQNGAWNVLALVAVTPAP